MNLSIIIPAHNEEKRFQENKTLETYGDFFKKIKGVEIIIVLNACTDNTIAVVKKAEKKYKFMRHIDLKIPSKGYAVMQGFKNAKGDVVGFVDADMSTLPDAFYELYKNLGNYDGIIASRWIKGAKADRGLSRLIRSKGFNVLARLLFLFPYKDTQCGAKIFKKQAIDKIFEQVEITRWSFDVFLLYQMKRNKFRVKEYPTTWVDKEGGGIEGIKKGIKTSFQMATGLIRLRLLYSPFKFIVRLYDKFPEKIKVHNW